MTDKPNTERREITPSALQVFNWYRQEAGHQPANVYTESVVSDEEWAAMKPDQRAELWAKYPTKERP